MSPEPQPDPANLARRRDAASLKQLVAIISSICYGVLGAGAYKAVFENTGEVSVVAVAFLLIAVAGLVFTVVLVREAEL